MKKILQDELRQYLKQKINQQKLKAVDRHEISEDVKVVFTKKILYEGNEEEYLSRSDDIGEPLKKKRFYESFLDLSNYRKRSRTDDLLKSMKSLIQKEQLVNNRAQPMSGTQLLGYMLYGINYHEGDKK